MIIIPKQNFNIFYDAIINKGPEVEQKEISLWPSYLEISFFSRKSEASLAPTGYPDTAEIAKTKALFPETLKIN